MYYEESSIIDVIIKYTAICLSIGGFGFLCYLSCFTVKQQTKVLIERFGKYHKTANEGLNFKIPFVDKIAAVISLKIHQTDVEVETITKDKVSVTLMVPVQYFVIVDKAKEAFYKLSNPIQQIESFVFDVVRAQVPDMNLDDLFIKKDTIADAVKAELSTTMDDFGYDIVKALVTDINPDKRVKDSMNEINAAQRMRVAANEKGEADKILLIKAAEAEKESKKLNGEGIAEQRKAIIGGLRESVSEFKESVEGSTAKDVMTLVMITQYFDTLKELGGKSNTIMIPHSPSAVNELTENLRNSIIIGNQIKEN